MSTPRETELDISDPADVLLYLAKMPFASTRAEPLSGGTANFIFRLYLRTPYEGRPTVVLKHAKAWLPGNRNFKFAVERQEYEAIALQSVKALLPSDSLVTVPTMHYHDAVAHVLIMEDCGPEARNLKQLFLEDPPSPTISRQIGDALGTFLAAVHTKGHEDCALMDTVRRNEEGKRLTAFVSYGWLIQTLKGEGTSKGLIEPPLAPDSELSAADFATIDELAQETAQAIHDADTVFTMGDFWTGNVVVRMQPENAGALERVFVIDWEITKPGLPFLDLAQFAAEMHLLRRFQAETAPSVSAVLDAYFAAYKMGAGAEVDEAFVRGAAAHLGTHLVASTPRTGWAPKEVVRDVVKEGLGYLLGSRKAETDWLQSSIVGKLLDRSTVAGPQSRPLS